jgi:hypothetical protein
MHNKHSHFSSGLDQRFLQARWKQAGQRVMQAHLVAVTRWNDTERIDVFATSLSGNNFPDCAVGVVSTSVPAQRVSKAK